MHSGVGIGFRSEIADEIFASQHTLDFVELVPENWIGVGGRQKRMLDQVVERFPISTHGLSLSIGSPDPLDWDFLKQLKAFFKQVPAFIFSEHLSYSRCDNAHVYELLPIPFTTDAVKHISERIRIVQDYLERPLAIENVSYYTPVAPQMDEATFIRSIVEKSGCKMLLDVNNVYVNAFNHSYNPKQFLLDLPLDQVAYIHMAGHTQVSDDLIVDTHGEKVIPDVFELLEWTFDHMLPVPVLLERDFDFSDFSELSEELNTLKRIVHAKHAAHV